MKVLFEKTSRKQVKAYDPYFGIQLFTTFGKTDLIMDKWRQTDYIRIYIRRSKGRREAAIRAPQNIEI